MSSSQSPATLGELTEVQIRGNAPYLREALPHKFHRFFDTLVDLACRSETRTPHTAQAPMEGYQRTTPRTDALLLVINEGRVYEHHGSLVEHARQLEVEVQVWEQRCHEAEANATQHFIDLQAARSAIGPLGKLAELMVKGDVDVDICPPGNHGGSGADTNRWLVTLLPSDHRNIREFFGNTLEEAIGYAVL